jgi:hypothetical protein
MSSLHYEDLAKVYIRLLRTSGGMQLDNVGPGDLCTTTLSIGEHSIIVCLEAQGMSHVHSSVGELSEI